jgi:molybdenum cofactor biosynthesis enzyme
VQFTFVIPAQAGIQDIKNTPSVIAMSPQLRLKKKSIFFNRQL